MQRHSVAWIITLVLGLSQSDSLHTAVGEILMHWAGRGDDIPSQMIKNLCLHGRTGIRSDAEEPGLLRVFEPGSFPG